MRSKKEEKLYLADFEFISGEYEQLFQIIFYAKDEEHLERKIHKHLVNYYGEGNTSDIGGDVYFYWNGEVAVRNCGWKEIKSFEELLSKHL